MIRFRSARLLNWVRTAAAVFRSSHRQGPAPRELVVALDVGSSRIACALAEAEPSRMRLLAAESVPCYGMRNGVIVDLSRAADSIRIALQAVETAAQADVRSVVVGFAPDLRMSVVHGSVPLDPERRTVGEADMDRLRKSISPACGPQRRVVHRFDGPFSVGELNGVERPVGLMGSTLSMSSSLLTVPSDRLQDLLRAVRMAGVEVETLAPDPLAASFGALSDDERALGAAVLDFGAGGARGALWEGGRLRQLSTSGAETPGAAAPPMAGAEELALGVARRFRLPPAVAQRLIREWDGCEGAAFEVASADGLGNVRVERADLAAAIEELLTPSLRAIRDGLSSFSTAHAGGLVLSGQGANLLGLQDLVSRHFGGAPVRLGQPRWETSSETALPKELQGPGGCTLYGLLTYGADLRNRIRERDGAVWWGRLRSKLNQVAAVG